MNAPTDALFLVSIDSSTVTYAWNEDKKTDRFIRQRTNIYDRLQNGDGIQKSHTGEVFRWVKLTRQ